MNARVPPASRISQREKRVIYEYAQQELKRLECNQMRRFFKLTCYVLNRKFGFGKQRCLKTTNGIAELAKEHERDEIFWHHIDKVIIDEMQIDFEREGMR